MIRQKIMAMAMAATLPFPGAWAATSNPAHKPASIAAQPNQVIGDEITPAQQEAVEKGLAWLAGRQDRNGAFSASQNGYSATSGITSLCALAFMAAGNLPGRGKYGDVVGRAKDYILDSAQPSGLLSADPIHGVMYSHGFATLFLGELYGMTQDDRVREKLEKAVRLIERTQNPEGGWRYVPAPIDADISVTICQIMGLRAARDAGIKVEKSTIDRAIAYVRKCQNPDGGFSYMATGGGGSGFERTAAGVASLYYAGVFEGNDLDRGLKYLADAGKNNSSMIGHYYYGQYYAAQAMFLAGGKYWSDWYPRIRDELIGRQGADGQWSGEVSTEYNTAIALIVLQMPGRYLPVFSGKGPGS